MIGEKEMEEWKMAAKYLRGNCGWGKDSLLLIAAGFSNVPVI